MKLTLFKSNSSERPEGYMELAEFLTAIRDGKWKKQVIFLHVGILM